MGQKVEFAEDGQVAVGMRQEKKYDLIFMDLQMPVLDGFGSTVDLGLQ